MSTWGPSKLPKPPALTWWFPALAWPGSCRTWQPSSSNADPGQSIPLACTTAQFRACVSFQLIESLLQSRVACRRTAQLDERSHDRDVHGDCLFSLQNHREHCYALLGKHIRRIAAATRPAV